MPLNVNNVDMKCRFPSCLARVLSIVVILLTANASVWAAQVVVEESHGQDGVVSVVTAQIALDDSQHAPDSRGKPLQGIDCDHSCHASAHFLALGYPAQPPVAMGSLTLNVTPAYRLPDPPADPPFIPPIA